MKLELEGKSVLVTGGSRGIGYACCHLFAEEGCRVTLLGSQQASVDAAVRRLESETGETAEALCVDLGHPGAVAAIADRLSSADIVVNNAGAIPGGGLEGVDDARWRAAWELKVFGYIDATRVALPAMLARGHGVIVNVIGIAGAAPRYDYVCGSTANAALIAFTKAAGAHAARRGVRVVGVNPGPTETDRLVNLYKARAAEQFGDASRWRDLLAGMPFGRVAQPQEIADLVAFLASRRASYISGTVIDIDGGAMHAGQ
jgi:NAD(P)-dependent dehydrogenase (short-subunit alcohol dehydrogenase family)